MFAKIVVMAILLVGAIFPLQFKRITDFWRVGATAPTQLTINVTRIFCLIAIPVIWFFF